MARRFHTGSTFGAIIPNTTGRYGRGWQENIFENGEGSLGWHSRQNLEGCDAQIQNRGGGSVFCGFRVVHLYRGRTVEVDVEFFDRATVVFCDSTGSSVCHTSGNCAQSNRVHTAARP